MSKALRTEFDDRDDPVVEVPGPPGASAMHPGTTSVTAAHAVLPSDEGRHDPDAEDLWNESYYCDFVRPTAPSAAGCGSASTPTASVAWWTAWIVRPGRPGVCSVDYRRAGPPGERSRVGVGCRSARVEIDLRRPLEEFRLAARVPATTIGRPADVYAHGEATGPTDRARPRPDLDHRRRPVPLRAHDPLRDPLPRHRQRHHRRSRPSRRRAGPAGPLLGRAGLVGLWMVLVLACASTTAPASTWPTSACPGMPVFFGYIQTPGAVASRSPPSR